MKLLKKRITKKFTDNIKNIAEKKVKYFIHSEKD